MQLRRDLLGRALLAEAPPAAHTWLVEARRRLAQASKAPAELQRLSASAGRALGATLLTDTLRIPTAAGDVAVNQLTLADAARLTLILETLECIPRGVAAWLHDYFRAGDESEQIALVRGLALLRDDAGLKPIAAEAGRGNSVALFSALALDNPYPAAYYGVREFNQLMLKALFLGNRWRASSISPSAPIASYHACARTTSTNARPPAATCRTTSGSRCCRARARDGAAICRRLANARQREAPFASAPRVPS